MKSKKKKKLYHSLVLQIWYMHVWSFKWVFKSGQNFDSGFLPVVCDVVTRFSVYFGKSSTALVMDCRPDGGCYDVRRLALLKGHSFKCH